MGERCGGMIPLPPAGGLGEGVLSTARRDMPSPNPSRKREGSWAQLRMRIAASTNVTSPAASANAITSQ
jgi:hypothetical protein